MLMLQSWRSASFAGAVNYFFPLLEIGHELGLLEDMSFHRLLELRLVLVGAGQLGVDRTA